MPKPPVDPSPLRRAADIAGIRAAEVRAEAAWKSAAADGLTPVVTATAAALATAQAALAAAVSSANPTADLAELRRAVDVAGIRAADARDEAAWKSTAAGSLTPVVTATAAALATAQAALAAATA